MAFHELTIKDVRQETPDSVAISFDLPDGLAGAFAHRPGQHLTLRAEIDGQDLRRSYSIAGANGASLTVGVKHVEGGVFSGFAQRLQAGDRLLVMPPEGRFISRDEDNILLVAAGSGITPIVSIARAALARGAQVTLIYGNRDSRHIMFRATLDALKDRHMARFTLIHLLSRETQDFALLNGRVSGEKLLRLVGAGAVDLAGLDGAFLCGPGEMITDVEVALRDAGVAAERIHHELFTPAEGACTAPMTRAARAAAQAGVEVEVILDGSRRMFHLEQDDTSLIDAAARVGLELPYSCKGGMCCTCRCQVKEGSAEMAVNYSLEPWEVEAGYTLACQARPTSPKLVLDFDAA